MLCTAIPPPAGVGLSIRRSTDQDPPGIRLIAQECPIFGVMIWSSVGSGRIDPAFEGDCECVHHRFPARMTHRAPEASPPIGHLLQHLGGDAETVSLNTVAP